MAEYHHPQIGSNNTGQGQPHQNYYLPSQQIQQQFGQNPPRPQHSQQSMIQQQQQQSPQQQQQGTNGMSSSMHNYLTSQHHQQQMQSQMRSSATPPNQQTMIVQQRQQGFAHPGMIQQMRQQQMHQQQQNNHGSPQQQQQMFQHQQTIVQQRQIVVRPVGIASPQQNIANSQQQQSQPQHYMQFVRQSGMQNVTSSSSSSISVVGQSQQQFVSPAQQGQMRQMLAPGAIFRPQNVVIQRENKPAQIIRFPQQQQSTGAGGGGMVNADKLSPQQELHVLQQHFPSAQIHQQQQYQQQQQQAQSQQHRFIAAHHPSQQMAHVHVIQQHNQPQQMPTTIISNSSGSSVNGSPVAVFVSSNGQQQHYVQNQQQIHNFASPPPNSMIAQQNVGQTMKAEILEGNFGHQQMMEYGLGMQESGRVSIKQETSPADATTILDAQQNQLQSPSSTDSHTAPSSTKNATKKPIGKAPTKVAANNNNNSAVTTQKNIGNNNNKAQSAIGNKPSTPPDSELIKASLPGQMAQKLLDRNALDSLVKSVDPNEILEDEVADALQLILDDFVEDIISNSAEVSQHRGSSKIEARDARYILATKFKMAIPSESFLGGTILSNNSMFGGTTGLPPPAKRPALIAHQQRMALIDKTLKKL